MTSPVVTRLLKNNRSVVQHIETNAALLDEKLRALAAPFLRKGEKMPDWSLVVRLLGRVLAARGDAMEAADDANEAEKRDDVDPSRRLEIQSDALYAATTRTREVLAGAFTAAKLPSLGFKGETPRAPDALVRFVNNVLKALASPLPEAQDGASVDVKKIVHRLTPLRDAVAELSVTVGREARELQQTQSARNAAVGANTDAFRDVAGTVSALLDLAGEPALAERTRPSSRSPGVTIAEESGPGSEGETTIDPPAKTQPMP